MRVPNPLAICLSYEAPLNSTNLQLKETPFYSTSLVLVNPEGLSSLVVVIVWVLELE